MGMWANAVKKATSFGTKGFIYGAAIGAVLAVAALAVGAAVMYGLGISEIVVTEASKAGTIGMLDTARRLITLGAKEMTFGTFAQFAGAGAIMGAGVGGASGAALGGVYGAATDESNPMPKLVKNTAHRITEKIPVLAKAIAREVEQKERLENLAAPSAADASQGAPPLLASPAVNFAPASDPRFRERLAAQAKEVELAAANGQRTI